MVLTASSLEEVHTFLCVYACWSELEEGNIFGENWGDIEKEQQGTKKVTCTVHSEAALTNVFLSGPALRAAHQQNCELIHSSHSPTALRWHLWKGNVYKSIWWFSYSGVKASTSICLWQDVNVIYEALRTVWRILWTQARQVCCFFPEILISIMCWPLALICLLSDSAEALGRRKPLPDRFLRLCSRVDSVTVLSTHVVPVLSFSESVILWSLFSLSQ